METTITMRMNLLGGSWSGSERLELRRVRERPVALDSARLACGFDLPFCMHMDTHYLLYTSNRIRRLCTS